MSELAKEITTITIEDELKKSYLDYAMSVIVGRALPDVRDGLKPVHRRVLFAMHELNNDWNKAYKKSARIVGDVIGKYHPHGDTAVYDTIVRMAQPFSLRYMLIDGQGNFGSVDGDSPAAMRYTEIRMSQLAHYLLADIDKNTVDFTANYDDTEQMPTVLPTQVPNLLVNGSSGIAVGMATNIPPHNLSEVVDAALALIDQPELTIDELMQHIPGPDFPTAGIINGRAGIIQAYRTGRGKIYVRAKTDVEINEKTNRATIVVHELPYQVNKARLLEKIGELVRDKKIEGITGLRDESDKDGMRMVIEVRRGDQPEVVLNNLYSQTQLQTVFGINMVALSNGRPQVMNLKFILNEFLQHRRDVVTRRTLFDLAKAKQRAHILEGLGIALVNIDTIVALIKAAKSPQEAKEALLAQSWPPGIVAGLLSKTDDHQTRPDNLPEEYGLNAGHYVLSPVQAQAILELRLHRLTGLETNKIHDEYKALIELINELLTILADPDRLHAVIREELLTVKQQFGDARRTVIMENHEDLNHEDLITVEDLAITLSQQGYIKAQPLEHYEPQHRGGRGKRATSVKAEDYVKNLLVVNSHFTILCFSTSGKVYWLKAYRIPQAGRTARGQPIVNLLPLDKEESITAILPVSEFDETRFIFMATQNGTVKKVALSEFANARSNGKIALSLNADDRLIGVALTDGEQSVMLFSNAGKAVRFSENKVRAMGRTATGIRGIRLREGQKLIALIIPTPESNILTVTEHGYGQRTKVDDYRECGRGGQGVIAIQTTDRNGDVIGAIPVVEDGEIMLVTDGGTLVRMPVNEISVIGRNTKGVRLIKVQEGERVVSVESIESDVSAESSESA